MKVSTEYRDAWRGLRMVVPAGWQVRGWGPGLVLHDDTGKRAILLQPRPGPCALDDLERALEAWLRRFDDRAELQAEPDAPEGARLRAARLRPGQGKEARGLFALEARGHGALLSGYLVPDATYEPDSRGAIEVLRSLQAAPAVERYLWREESEGAASALVPRGWRVEARISRQNPLGMPAAGFQAWADDWVGVLASAETRLYLEPGLLGGLLGGLAGGLIGQGRFVDAAGYAEEHLLPALRTEEPEARIERIVSRADLIPTTVARDAASSGLTVRDVLLGQPSVADVTLALGGASRPMRQISRVVTMRVPPSMGRGLPLWMAAVPRSHRAPVDRWDEWEPVLEGIAASFRVSPDWRRKEQARLMRQFGRGVPGVEQRGEASGLLAEAERLFCERSQQPLGLHERPFSLERNVEAEADEGWRPWPEAGDESIWSTPGFAEPWGRQRNRPCHCEEAAQPPTKQSPSCDLGIASAARRAASQ
ncbi:MAG: hypothetical protein QME94_17960 [Anaerolineae bacterium]|nr:hypothetical protein [Anaerolineae bacterium]